MNFKKTFVWCPDVEAYITFIADKRDYEDVDLNIEFGLDAGIFNERMSCKQPLTGIVILRANLPTCFIQPKITFYSCTFSEKRLFKKGEKTYFSCTLEK